MTTKKPRKKTLTIERVEAMFNDIFLDSDVPQNVKDRLHYHLATIRLCENIDAEIRIEPAQVASRAKGNATREKILNEYESVMAKNQRLSTNSAAKNVAKNLGLKPGPVRNIIMEYLKVAQTDSTCKNV
jgi:hypothetical protein